jgi:Pyridoxamine 5'-phosphate oxidase
MARWQDIEDSDPEFAARVRALLDARVHKTLATLRRDGSPRICGTEAKIVDGDVWFGSMAGALKARDLQRDPRFALHGGSIDPPEWTGDAKLSGRVVEIKDPETRARVFGAWGQADGHGESHLFRADILDVSLVCLGDPRDHLVIEHWSPERGHRRWKRK